MVVHTCMKVVGLVLVAAFCAAVEQDQRYWGAFVKNGSKEAVLAVIDTTSSKLVYFAKKKDDLFIILSEKTPDSNGFSLSTSILEVNLDPIGVYLKRSSAGAAYIISRGDSVLNLGEVHLGVKRKEEDVVGFFRVVTLNDLPTTKGSLLSFDPHE